MGNRSFFTAKFGTVPLAVLLLPAETGPVPLPFCFVPFQYRSYKPLTKTRPMLWCSVFSLAQGKTKKNFPLLTFRFIHLGPKLTSLLFPDSTPETGHPVQLRNLFSVDPDSVFVLCGNSIKSSGPLPDQIPPDAVIIHYGFQVSCRILIQKFKNDLD